ncbi:hypothetical protein BpHYR1_025733 [Brachionus plicatilis]|uniref:Uncharacterized protein n=1 Tax=Brachionus plicatilis TaxID=10195 RepID=A0A3M7RKJ1_BRAPC|nr:hypothetical protein BpHYR1_025733 [Brachionus plicatilis]
MRQYVFNYLETQIIQVRQNTSSRKYLLNKQVLIGLMTSNLSGSILIDSDLGGSYVTKSIEYFDYQASKI